VYGPLQSHLYRDTHTNICEYTAAVIFGALMACMAAAGIGALFLAPMLLAAMRVVFVVYYGEVGDADEMTRFGQMLWIAAGTSLAAFGIIPPIITICTAVKKWLNKRQGSGTVHSEEPSVVTQMYRAWKDKTCFRIHIK
jgi:hypothetical protein